MNYKPMKFELRIENTYSLIHSFTHSLFSDN